VLREDNRAIVRAASQATKAADYLLGFLPTTDLRPRDARPLQPRESERAE
jgi:antirestriction protein ArdC